MKTNHDITVSSLEHTFPWSIIGTALISEVIETHQTLYHRDRVGTPKDPEFLKNFQDKIKSNNYKLLADLSLEWEKEANKFWLFAHNSELTYIGLAWRYSEWRLSIISVREESIPVFEDIYSEFFSLKENTDNEIFALRSSSDGLRLSEIGKVTNPLVRTNYSKETLEAYDYVVEQLKLEKPRGRLVIFNGPPGVGKTHLLTGLVSEISGVKFVIIGSDMISELTQPSFLSVLMSNVGDPFILLLEDADSCLTAKSRERVSDIQAILNLADGILGGMLDIRIVATSNVATSDMDKAILRPGRLCKHIEVGNLNSENALAAYAAMGGANSFTESKLAAVGDSGISLAEIYSLDLDPVLYMDVQKARKFGF